MKDKNDLKTQELFPVELQITRLICNSIRAKVKKEETRFEFGLQGGTNARFATDLKPDDYLVGAAEYLVELCANSERLAKQKIDEVYEKYNPEELVDMMAGVGKPAVSGGTISMTFSTAIPFFYNGVIVEKDTLIKLIAAWVLTLAQADIDNAYYAINSGYLRIVNRDNVNVVQFGKVA